MSWLTPKGGEGMMDPEEHERNDLYSIESFIKENGEKAGEVLEIYKEVDPLGVNVGGEAQYLGYVKKFWERCKSLENPREEDIENWVKKSFYESQLSNPILLEPEKLEELVIKIKNIFI